MAVQFEQQLTEGIYVAVMTSTFTQEATRLKYIVK